MKNDVQQPLIPYGWLRGLVYFLVILVVEVGLQFFFSILYNALSWKPLKDDEQLLQMTFQFGISCVVILLVTWLVRKTIDKKCFKSLGFSFFNYKVEAAIGFTTAIAILGFGTLLLVASGSIRFIGFESSYSQIFAILLMIAVAVSEEVMFRGYILNNLMQSVNKWAALSISSIFFALVHLANPGISLLAIFNIAAAGFLLGINYIYTKNLWFSIFFHFSWNYFQGSILGYKVSGLPMSGGFQQIISGADWLTGGIFGFEGSVLCSILLTATFFVFMYEFSRRYAKINV